MTARRGSTGAVAGVVVTALIVVMLATWAASIGTGRVLRDDAGEPTRRPASSVSPDDVRPPSGSERLDRTEASGGWRLAALVVEVAVVLGVCYLLLRLGMWERRVRRERWARRGRQRATASVDFDVLERPEVVARELLADADGQRRALLEGSPRNAVVACWHRFEVQAAAAGLERAAWETSSEYTIRVLDLVDAHQPAVSRLAGLYREARFSEHQLTEAHRQEALEALDTIHRTIGVGA